jgi:chromosome segregation ATPase
MSEQFGGSSEFTEHGAPRWVGIAVIALAAISVLGLGVAWNATRHSRGTEQALEAQGRQGEQIQKNLGAMSQRLEHAEEVNAQLMAELKAVTDRLKMTQGELANARRQAGQIRTEYSQKLDTVQTQIEAKANASDVNTLGGDLSGVKTDLETTKNNLQLARGEFGGLIARTHEEIEQLRRVGARDYYEFSVEGKGKRARVGNMLVELRGTDTKRNQFTVALYVDDMRLEKKNRSIDEPIYFYSRGVRVPMELVVNQVGKNQVAGYLSVPKAQPATTTIAGPTGN